MTQQETAHKLTDAITMGHDITDALKLAYAVGFDRGRDLVSHSKPVIQLTLEGRPLTIHPSAGTAERITGIDSGSISRAATGKRKKAGGYKWRYLT